MIKFCLVPFAFFLLACQPNQHGKDLPAALAVAEEAHTVQDSSSESASNTNIYIKDSADYSLRFIRALGESPMGAMALVDSLLILNSTDTAWFPTEPPIGEQLYFIGREGELMVGVHIERINYTTLDYRIEMLEWGHGSHNDTGQADLHPQFYFGAETDVHSPSELAYLSTEYHHYQDSCYTYIRIGREPQHGRHLLAKLVKNCNGKIRDIGLDDFPSLWEKE